MHTPALRFRIGVDPRSGYPIYLQIIAQIQRAIALGMLAAGEQLPTVKQLASELVVNPSTISRAMRELEYLGVIVSQPGRGSFVSTTAAASIAISAASESVVASLRAALRDAFELGVDAQTARELVESAFAATYGERAAMRS